MTIVDQVGLACNTVAIRSRQMLSDEYGIRKSKADYPSILFILHQPQLFFNRSYSLRASAFTGRI